jgi:glycosyltransferase involved in cell wall biosynthesis
VKVSIVTVCKNSEKTIDRAISSIVSQIYADIEYIIVDGDSQDGTKAIIDRYTSRITYLISEPDAGVYQAMNKAIRIATGSWIYFVNSDDYLFDEDVIQDLVAFLSTCADCDFIYGDHEARYTTGDAAIHKPASPDRMLEELVSLGECMIQPACFFKAELFTKVGLFNEAYRIASDYEWFARLLQDASLKLCYYPRTLASYAHGGLSSNIPALFQEVFAIQNQMPLYQQEPWFTKRVQKLQQSFIDKYDLLEKTHKLSIARLHHIESAESQICSLNAQIVELKQAQTNSRLAQPQNEVEGLRSQVSTLQSRVEAMETSKFWKLRQVWFDLKRFLGLKVNE